MIQVMITSKTILVTILKIKPKLCIFILIDVNTFGFIESVGIIGCHTQLVQVSVRFCYWFINRRITRIFTRNLLKFITRSFLRRNTFERLWWFSRWLYICSCGFIIAWRTKIVIIRICISTWIKIAKGKLTAITPIILTYQLKRNELDNWKAIWS